MPCRMVWLIIYLRKFAYNATFGTLLQPSEFRACQSKLSRSCSCIRIQTLNAESRARDRAKCYLPHNYSLYYGLILARANNFAKCAGACFGIVCGESPSERTEKT